MTEAVAFSAWVPGSAARGLRAVDPCALAVQAPPTWMRTCGTVRVPASRRRTGGTAPEVELYHERSSRGTVPTVVYLTGGPGAGLDGYAGLGVITKMLAALNGQLVLNRRWSIVPSSASQLPRTHTKTYLSASRSCPAKADGRKPMSSLLGVSVGRRAPHGWSGAVGPGLQRKLHRNHNPRFSVVWRRSNARKQE